MIHLQMFIKPKMMCSLHTGFPSIDAFCKILQTFFAVGKKFNKIKRLPFLFFGALHFVLCCISLTQLPRESYSYYLWSLWDKSIHKNKTNATAKNPACNSTGVFEYSVVDSMEKNISGAAESWSK